MTEIEHLYLLRNQVRILYSQSRTTFLFPPLFAVVLYQLLRDVAVSATLQAWVFTIVGYAIVRYGFLWLHAKSRITAENIHAWLYLFIAGAFVSGLLWGLAPVILVPYTPDSLLEFTLHNGLILLLICCLVAGAGIAYSVNLLLMYAYSSAVLLLPSVYLVTLGDKFSTVLGGFLFLYYVFVNISVLRLNRQFLHYLQMEYRYEQMVARQMQQEELTSPGHSA